MHRVAPFRQSWSRAIDILGPHLWGVQLSENGRRRFVYACLEPRSNDKKNAENQVNVRCFELSWKRRAPCMPVRECISHFLYDLRCLPLVHHRIARVRGQISSDHRRSDLIAGRTHWVRVGYPFPEVNLSEQPISQCRGPPFPSPFSSLYPGRHKFRFNFLYV